MSRCQFLLGDVFTHMATIPDHSVDLIVTSPPFLALRSYLPPDHPDKGKEIGSEATPAAFLSTLLALTREWRRILAPHGSICVELGDTYSGSGGTVSDDDIATNPGRSVRHQAPGHTRSISARAKQDQLPKAGAGWPLAKSLCLIPSLYAGSLAYGHNLLDPDDRIEPLRVRNLIVWHRPNPPVGALGDKVRPATSYITTACVSGQRWFDLDAERTTLADSPGNRYPRRVTTRDTTQDQNNNNITADYDPGDSPGAPPLDCWIDGDVWTIPTAPYKGAHYATYPIALPRRLINLMCPREVCTVCGEPRRRITSVDYEPHGQRVDENKGARGVVQLGEHAQHMEHGRATKNVETLGWTDCGHQSFRRGVVCDPFAGSGTTLAAAAESGRDAIGIDLDERNLWLIRERVGLFLSEVE